MRSQNKMRRQNNNLKNNKLLKQKLLNQNIMKKEVGAAILKVRKVNLLKIYKSKINNPCNNKLLKLKRHQLYNQKLIIQ